jgi:hypothetical protein
MSNPYQAPSDDGLAPAPEADRFHNLQRIADHHRLLNISFLVYFGAGYFLGNLGGPEMNPVRLLVALGVFLFAGYAAVGLAGALYGKGWAVVFGVLVCVPLVNLIALLVLSSGASRRMRLAGVPVGFLGADPKVVRAHIAADRAPAYTGPKLAGKTCVHCKRTILVEGVALPCKRCGEPVHKDCRKPHRAEAHPRNDAEAQADPE